MRTIAVIGDSRGIGMRLREQLLANGHRVIGISRSGGVSAGNYVSISHDAVEHPLNLASEVESLDGLVYCIGSINLKPFRSLKPEQILEDLRVNYLGAFANIQENFNLLKKGDAPSVVLFSTVAVDQGMPFHSSVAGAKGAVQGLARALAAEFAPAIRVNCIAPSLTDTPLAEPLLNNDRKREAAMERHPLKRFGTVEDIAGAAAFLLSKDAAWITGQVLGVDGGLSHLKV